jgi:hypothetical protein
MTEIETEEHIDPTLISGFLLQRHASLLASYRHMLNIGRLIMVLYSGVYVLLDLTSTSVTLLYGTCVIYLLFWLLNGYVIEKQVNTIEEVMSRSFGKRNMKAWEHRYIEIRSMLGWGSKFSYMGHFLSFPKLFNFLEPYIWFIWISFLTFSYIIIY